MFCKKKTTDLKVVEKEVDLSILNEAEQLVYQLGSVATKANPDIFDEDKVSGRKLLGLAGRIVGDMVLGIDKYGMGDIDLVKFGKAFNEIKNKLK